jgi:hypothetical protein
MKINKKILAISILIIIGLTPVVIMFIEARPLFYIFCGVTSISLLIIWCIWQLMN